MHYQEQYGSPSLQEQNAVTLPIPEVACNHNPTPVRYSDRHKNANHKKSTKSGGNDSHKTLVTPV